MTIVSHTHPPNPSLTQQQLVTNHLSTITPLDPNTRQISSTDTTHHSPTKHPTACNPGSLHVSPIPPLTPVDTVDPVDNQPKMSESSTPPYIHAGSVLRSTHQPTTRCENVLRQVLAKDADRLARRPIASTERTLQNHDSVKHWLAQTAISVQSPDPLSSRSSLVRSQSVSSKPTYLSRQLVDTAKSVFLPYSLFISILIFVQNSSVTHTPLANNQPLSPSPAVPEHHSSHLGHRLGHRHHQSLTGPRPTFLPPPDLHPLTPSSPLPLNGLPLDYSRPLPAQSTQDAQNTSLPSTQTPSAGPGLFGAPTQLHQPTPPSPIQCAATAAVLRNPSTSSMNPSDVQSRLPRPTPRIARKHSASSANVDHSPARPILHHPRARPHATYLTDWTTAESPDVSSRCTMALLSDRPVLTAVSVSLAGRVLAKPDAPNRVFTESLLYRLHARHGSARPDMYPAMHSAVIQHQSCQRSLSKHPRLCLLL